MSLRSFVLFVLISAFILTACAPAPTVTSEQAAGDLTKIRLPMGYIPNVQFAPFYVASEMGFFQEAGLEIEFDYNFETDAVALVASGERPFAVVSGEQVLLARAQGLPVVYIVAWYQEYPVAVVAKQETGINELSDLTGRRIGLPGLFGANYIGLRALLSFAGISEQEVTLDVIGYNQVEALTVDQEDAVVVYTNNEPVQLEARGYEISTIAVSDYLQLPSNGLITNEDTLRNNPELVSQMVASMLRGIRYASTYPDEAYEICLKYVENLAEADQTIQREILDVSIQIWSAERLGYSQPEAWENMQQVLLEMGLLQTPLNLEDAYTNEFIP
jgi:NitT/TauT family transport system substrate-binding protein